jgi:SPW repeat
MEVLVNKTEPGNYWACWVLFALGVWELIAPFVLKYGPHFSMTANGAVSGVLIMMFAFWAVATDDAWATRAVIGFGAWLVVSAVVFERVFTRALVNDLAVGVVAIALAIVASRHGRAAWQRGWPTIERGEGFLK